MRYLFVLLMLAGCTRVYTQPGKGSMDFERDLDDCERGYAAMQNRALADERVDRCLKAKGWTQK